MVVTRGEGGLGDRNIIAGSGTIDHRPNAAVRLELRLVGHLDQGRGAQRLREPVGAREQFLGGGDHIGLLEPGDAFGVFFALGLAHRSDYLRLGHAAEIALRRRRPTCLRHVQTQRCG